MSIHKLKDTFKSLGYLINDQPENIVATIQREQQRIILSGEASLLIFLGIAGSGKPPSPFTVSLTYPMRTSFHCGIIKPDSND